MAATLNLEHIRALHGRIALDVETTGGFAPHLGKLVGLGVWAEDAGVLGFLPCDGSEASRQAISKMVQTWVPGSTLITHNGKYEFKWLDLDYEWLVKFKHFDTMVAEHLLREELEKDLGSVETRYFRTHSKKKLVEMGKLHGGIKKIDQWPAELIAEYCTNDCRITYQVATKQTPLLVADKVAPFFKKQMKYMLRLYQQERRGVIIDMDYVQTKRTSAQRMVGEAEVILDRTLAELKIAPIKYGSPQKVSKLLYVDLGIPKPECPPELKGSPRSAQYNGTMTGKGILAELKHPVADAILKYRKLRRTVTMLTKYHALSRELGADEVGGWEEDATILFETKKGMELTPRYRAIHTTLKITGTRTGRLSSTDPNLQQVTVAPVGKEFDSEGKGILLRPTFVARKGFTFASIDYKQMEVVFFGVRSRDPKMLQLIAEGGDMHDLVAKMMFGKTGNPWRKWAKTIGLGLMYGMADAALADSLELPIEEARKLTALYHQTFVRVRPYMAEINAQLEANGFITYWSGRRRHITKKSAFYRGVNSDIQGGSADLLAEAVCRVAEYLDERGQGEGIIAPVHDELLIELRDDAFTPGVVAEIQKLMSVPDALGVAFGTDAELGRAWGLEVEEGAGQKFHRVEDKLQILELEAEEDDEED